MVPYLCWVNFKLAVCEVALSKVVRASDAEHSWQRNPVHQQLARVSVRLKVWV